MIIENIKSIVLFLLVAFSLLLTLALWTYQPQLEPLEQANILEETKLNGKEKSVKELIYPEKIVFHNYQEHKQFMNKKSEMEFYNEVLSWSFSSINDFPTTNKNLVKRNMEWTEATGWVRNNRYQSVEIQFPIDVPMDLINQIFTVNKKETTWDQTFNTIYFHLYNSSKEIQVVFASDDNSEVLIGEIQSSKAYERVEALLNSEQLMVNLNKYVFENGKSFYLPTEDLSMESYTLLTDNLSIRPMRNVLFSNPSLVQQTSSNSQSSYYTDGTRALITYSVLRNDKVMQFINPLSTENAMTNSKDLILKSIDFTNDHTGWTDDFRVDRINSQMNRIKYRMYFDGLPIFDPNQTSQGQITEMEQYWRNNELYELKRPLFQTGTPISNKQVTIPSGKSVYQTLQSLDEHLSLKYIEDIRVGYKLNTRSEVSTNVIILEPEWHIKFQDTWRPLSYFNDMLVNQGVE